MESATGALATLLPKLGKLLLEEYNLKKTVKKGIGDLKAELETMQTALEKVSNVPLDQLDSQVKLWANEVRDLSYVIEDSLDSFIGRVEGLELTNKPNPLKDFIKKACDKITRFKARNKFVNGIEDIETQIRKVNERFARYKISDVVANPVTSTVDPRHFTMYSKVSDLVGIDKAIEELTKRLSKADDLHEKNLKTVSVVGIGGLGKTTLVKAVYDKLSKKFDCGCFVPVGQNPDMKKVLKDILYDLDKKRYINIISSKLDEKQLTDEMLDFLKEKRYLIVIDDIWDTPTWEVIKCALVDGDTGSRIIATTRNSEVAERIGGVYNMKSLSEDNSKKLFYERICSGEDICFDVQSAKVSDKILGKCGGVPLSIITIASLLVGKQQEDWLKVYESIGFGQGDSEVIKNMRKILSFSFYDLPSRLKTCLLHLSMFPEEHLIGKHELIWIWIAEGFVPCERGLSLFEVGESYFNQLANRSMIRLIENINCLRIDSCRVHDMILDLIRNLSSELRFVAIHGIEQEQSPCLLSRGSSFRRLAVHRRSADHSPISMEMRQVRSFSAILCTDTRLLQLLSFKVLRVLVLEQCDFAVEGCRLEHLGKLVQLRYLGLTNTPVAELPGKIGHDLKFLQTLDIRWSGIKELSPSVCELSKLMCLRTSRGTRMMGVIGKLTSLEELELYTVDKCSNFVTDLGKLKEVRVLAIHFEDMDDNMHMELLKSLCNLEKIQNLNICSEPEEPVRVRNWEDWKPSSQLRALSLSGICLTRIPSWMNFSCVPHLSYLWLEVEVLEASDFQMLGKLQSLGFLNLRGDEDNNLLVYTVDSGEFEKLRYLETNIIEIICGGEGVLPMLENLKCRASVGIRKDDVGNLVPENMPMLQEVTYQLDCKNWSAEEVDEAEAVLWHANEIHPNHPAMVIRRKNYEVELLMQHISATFLEFEQTMKKHLSSQNKRNKKKHLVGAYPPSSQNEGASSVVPLDMSTEKNEEKKKPLDGVTGECTGELVKPGVSCRSEVLGLGIGGGLPQPKRRSRIEKPSWISGDPTSKSQEVVGASSSRTMDSHSPSSTRHELFDAFGRTMRNFLSHLTATKGCSSSPPYLESKMEDCTQNPAMMNTKTDMAQRRAAFTDAQMSVLSSMLSSVANTPVLGKLMSNVAAVAGGGAALAGGGAPAYFQSFLEEAIQSPAVINTFMDMVQGGEDSRMLQQVVLNMPIPQLGQYNITREEEEMIRKQILQMLDIRLNK